jgi:hypothetical protein
MQGSRGGVDIPRGDVDRVKSHLAKYCAKVDDTLRGTAANLAHSLRRKVIRRRAVRDD